MGERKMVLEESTAMYLIIICLVFLAGCSSPDKEASKLYAEASKLWKAVEGTVDPVEIISLGNDALAKLDMIVSKYPSSQLAGKLLAGEAKIGGYTITEFKQAVIIRAGTKEVLQCLLAIRAAQEAYKLDNGKYLKCEPSPPGGGTDGIPDQWVDAGGFAQIGVEFKNPVFFRYAVGVGKDGSSYTAVAHGDLDEDGTKVTYTLTSDSTMPRKDPMNEY